jgi:hypothetical protein
MPRKTFRVAVAAEPTSFDLEGPVRGVQNFLCRDRIAAGKLMKFAELFSAIEEDSEDSAQSAKAGAQAIPAIRDFFNAALIPEARARFWDMVESDEEGIPLDTLVDIAGWLAEVYSGGRPTGTNSEPGSEVTSSGDGSPATPSAADITTYSRPSGLTSSSI